MKKISPEELAKYVIKVHSRPEEWEFITNLKLQKILYYIQWFHLAFFDEPFFDEDIYARQYWPVVKSVYNNYKDKWSSGITELYEDDDFTKLISTDQQNLVSSVWDNYWQYSAFKLVEMTHDEFPWKNAIKDWIDSIITKESLKTFFKTQLD